MEQYCSEDIKQLAKALIEVQRDMSPATKDAVNPFCRNKYATLTSIMESCRPALIKHGIWLTQITVPLTADQSQNHLALLTKLTHADSGQWQSSLTIVPLPKADPQGMGSAITYARRYALSAMLGIVTEDDDGEGAKLDPRETASQRKPQHNNDAQPKKPQAPDPQEAYTIQDLDESTDVLARLPKLEGIAYKLLQADDGRDYIVASGNTMLQKGHLKNAGFRWDAQGKVWWMYANAA